MVSQTIVQTHISPNAETLGPGQPCTCPFACIYPAYPPWGGCAYIRHNSQWYIRPHWRGVLGLAAGYSGIVCFSCLCPRRQRKVGVCATLNLPGVLAKCLTAAVRTKLFIQLGRLVRGLRGRYVWHLGGAIEAGALLGMDKCRTAA